MSQHPDQQHNAPDVLKYASIFFASALLGLLLPAAGAYGYALAEHVNQPSTKALGSLALFHQKALELLNLGLQCECVSAGLLTLCMLFKDALTSPNADKYTLEIYIALAGILAGSVAGQMVIPALMALLARQ
jgi:hypothetical protein